MKKRTGARGKSNKYIVAGATVSTTLVAAQSVIPAAVYAANQYDWLQQEGIDTSGGSITAAAMSATGGHLILGGEGNVGLYVSDNSGATWENIAEEVDPGATHFWSSFDVSNDGQVMVATSDEGYDNSEEVWLDGKVFISEDGGDSWNDVSPADTDDWSDVVVSGDGSTIAATRWNSGDVYISENDGADWTITPFSGGFGNGKAVAISDNGNKILVGGENSEDIYTHLYLSDDSGDTWQEIDPDTEDLIYTMSPAISADGNTIAVATTGWNEVGNDSIFISENDGADWTDITPDDGTPTEWSDLAMSDNGSALTALDEENNKMYISNNSGTDWTEENPTQDYEDGSYLIATDINSDGTKLIVASQDNAYLNYVAEPENETTVTLDDAVGGKTISITTPEGTTITCHSAAKESEMTVTDTAYTYPLGLVDFCFSGADANNEVSLVFVTNLTPDEVLVRKYDPSSDEYSTVTEATVTETTYGGKHALQVTYTIVDNGPLDTDPDDGEIADPVGLAVVDTSNGSLAETGDNVSIAGLMAIGLLGLGLSFLLRQSKLT